MVFFFLLLVLVNSEIRVNISMLVVSEDSVVRC